MTLYFHTKEGVIFTYGDRIYNPSGVEISKPLLIHESTHSQRQGDDPDNWWVNYIEFAEFRLVEELLAHRAEYEAFKQYGRNQRRTALQQIANRLSSPLYGNMMSFKEAKKVLAV